MTGGLAGKENTAASALARQCRRLQSPTRRSETRPAVRDAGWPLGMGRGRGRVEGWERRGKSRLKDGNGEGVCVVRQIREGGACLIPRPLGDVGRVGRY